MPLTRLLAALQALRGRRARILCYHSISDRRTDRWAVGTRQFAAHLALLRQEGWAILPLQELVARLKKGQDCPRTVALTFDDGYLDFLENALPILKEFAAPATLFAPVGLLGGASRWVAEAPEAPLLDLPGLEQAARAGVEIGSHSFSHRRLPELDAAGLEQELAGSFRWLQARLGIAPQAFSYPFGEFGPREAAAARAAGYACACDFGGLLGNGRETDPYRLKRDPLTRPDGESGLRAILYGRRDLRRALRKLRLTPLR